MLWCQNATLCGAGMGGGIPKAELYFPRRGFFEELIYGTSIALEGATLNFTPRSPPMKTILLALALFAANAHADFVPGRIRPLFSAKMRVIAASGEFYGAQDPMLYQNFQDDRGFVSLRLSLSGGRTLDLPLLRSEDTGCGNYAWSQLTTHSGKQVRASFVDYSDARCAIGGKEDWKLKIVTQDPSGDYSVLEVEGIPQGSYVIF